MYPRSGTPLQGWREALRHFTISLEQNLPYGKPDEVSEPVTRSFPAGVSRKWRVLPFKVVAGSLHVAGPDVPCDEKTQDLGAFSSLEIRFQLVTPTDFEELAGRYLPPIKQAA